MGQQVSITELKEQIEAAKRSLTEMPPVTTAADPLFQPVAKPAALDQNMATDDMATDDMATDDMATDDMATDLSLIHI